MNAQDRSDLGVLIDITGGIRSEMTALRNEMTARFDSQDERLRRLEQKRVEDEAVAAAAEKAAERSGIRMSRVVGIAAAVSGSIVGVAGLVLRLMGH